MRMSSARTAASSQVGRMAELRPLAGEVEELDGRGLCALPGLVDCHTHACFAGDRAGEFELRRDGASYEELHAAGGGILVDGRGDARGRRGRAPRGRSPASRVDASRGHDDVRGEVGLRPRSRDRARVAAGDRGRGRGPDLARRARGAAGVRRRRRVPRLRARRGPAGGGADRRGGGCLPGARRLRPRRRRGAISRRAATRGSALRLHGDQFTEAGGGPARRRARCAVGRPPRGNRRRGVRTLADSEVVGVLLPVSALVLGRPMPPGAGARRRGRGSRPRDRLQPRERLLREPAARHARSLARSSASPRRGARGRAPSTRPTSSARGSNRKARARLRRGCASCSTRRTGATSPTTSAARS